MFAEAAAMEAIRDICKPEENSHVLPIPDSKLNENFDRVWVLQNFHQMGSTEFEYFASIADDGIFSLI